MTSARVSLYALARSPVLRIVISIVWCFAPNAFLSAQTHFIRGDANIDGTVDLSDAVHTFDYLLLGSAQSICSDATDANDDGRIDIAENSGLKQGDIILRYNDKSLRTSNQLKNAVAATNPGEKVELEVFRDGKKKTFDVEIVEREVNLRLTSGQEVEVDLGMTVKNLTPDIARQMNAGEETKGVVVTDVKSGGLAARVGIASGDIIVAVNGKEVGDIRAFRAKMSKEDLKKGIRMQVLRDGFRRFVFLKSTK